MRTSMPVRPVKWERDDDFGVLLWASLGRSYAFIRNATGLTNGQISYRLKKAGLKTTDYRNGIGLMAEFVDQKINQTVQNKMRRDMKLIG